MKQTHILPTTMMVLAVILAGCGNATPDTNRVASETSAATADHDDHDDHAEEKADHDDHGETDQDDEHDDHAESDGEPDGHDDHSESEGDVVKLTQDAATEAGIETAIVAEGAIAQSLSLPAEIRFDADRVANVSPKVSGVIGKLYASEGDHVARGDTLALIKSRELAGLKAFSSRGRMTGSRRWPARKNCLRTRSPRKPICKPRGRNLKLRKPIVTRLKMSSMPQVSVMPHWSAFPRRLTAIMPMPI